MSLPNSTNGLGSFRDNWAAYGSALHYVLEGLALLERIRRHIEITREAKSARLVLPEIDRALEQIAGMVSEQRAQRRRQ